MFPWKAILAGLAFALGATTGATAEPCPAADGGLGVSRIVMIDARSGPVFGRITRQKREASFLRDKEVVLTFDDGPLPWITRSILKSLEAACTKATFFPVGRMAVAHPEVVREILDRGHTIGSHTWSHPRLPSLDPEKAREDIERGFAAVALAAGSPIAPFFRFPGLADNADLIAHLRKRNIATFSVDVVSDDSFARDATKLHDLTMKRIKAAGGGIVLFHDIKSVTARALPQILRSLKSGGYQVVHLRPTVPVVAVATYDKELGPRIAKATIAAAEKGNIMPFFGRAGPHIGAQTAPAQLPVESVGRTREPAQPVSADPENGWTPTISRSPRRGSGS